MPNLAGEPNEERVVNHLAVPMVRFDDVGAEPRVGGRDLGRAMSGRICGRIDEAMCGPKQGSTKLCVAPEQTVVTPTGIDAGRPESAEAVPPQMTVGLVSRFAAKQ